MGTVFWRANRNAYYIDYTVKGRRIRRKIGRSKKLAEKALQRIEADMLNDKYELALEEEQTRFNELADYWLKNYSKVNNSPSQYRKNEERLDKHLRPFFGRTRAQDVNAKMIDEYKASKLGKLSPATINRTLALLKKIFNDAVRWGFMAKNPARGVSLLHEEETGFEFWSEEEADAFLAACAPSVYPIFCCALNTGMRIGEVLGLRWASVNLRHRVITVERSRLGTTKTKRVRRVYINDVLYGALRKLQKKAVGEYVFPGRDGKIRKDVRGAFNAAIKKAGVRSIRIHELRHTFASHFIMKGGNILTLQRVLGHSTLAMTLRYAHLAPDFMKDEMRKVSFGAAG